MLLVVFIFLSVTASFNVKKRHGYSHAVVRGERWGQFESQSASLCEKVEQKQPVLGVAYDCGQIVGQQWGEQIFRSLGDLHQELGEEDREARLEYNLNKGRALETLRRELPLVFFASNLDFSIFAQEILVNDGKNRFAMPHNVYTTVVKVAFMSIFCIISCQTDHQLLFSTVT